jgi:hypothetical protein
MSNTVIGASVEIEYKSVGNVRKALKEANMELLAMQEQFGAASKEAINAAKKVADLKDRIEDAKETADLFDPGKKFQAFVTLGSQIASGFAAVQGAMALVGTESEELQKQLLKVQGAMALAKGLSDLKDFGKSFQQIRTFITAATSQMGNFQKAIVATGIGALVVASGLLVAYWDDIKGFVTGYNKELEEANKKLEKQRSQAEYQSKLIEASRDSRIAQGITEEQITKELINQAIIIAKSDADHFKNLQAQREQQVAATKRNYEFVQGLAKFVLGIQRSIINIIVKPLDLAMKGVNKIRSLLGQEEVPNLIEKINTEAKKVDDTIANWVGKKLFDVEDVDKNIQDAKIKALESESEVARLRKKISDSQSAQNKKISDEQKKTDDERKKRIEEAIKAEAKANEDLIKSRLTDREKELFEIQKSYDEQKKIIEAGGQSTASLTELYEKQKADIEKKYKEERLKKEEEFQTVIKGLKDRLQQDAALSEQDTARKAIEDKYAKEREELMKQYPNNLALLILLKQNEKAELDKVDKDFAQKKAEEDSAKLLQQSTNEDLSFQERLAKISEREQMESQLVFKSEDDRLAFLKANSDAKKAIIAAETQFRIDQAQKAADVLNQLSDVVGKETAAGKVMAIAAATINTYLAASKALTGIKTGNPLGAAIAIAQTAAVIATGIKTIREIAKVKVPGGGGGSAPSATAIATAAPMQAGISPAVQGQALNAEAINNMGNQSLRAYVINSDIQNNDQRNAYLERNARIG